MSEIYDKFHDLGAFVNGGQPRRTVPLPPPPVPKIAHPTAALTIEGIEIRPAERLAALAKIRDRHRAAARMATDRMAAIREQIAERDLRIRLISQRIQPGFEAQSEGEIDVLRAEVEQLRAAQNAANIEAQEAAEAMGSAQSVLRSAIRFAVDVGATVPLLLASEVQK